jgi:copper oxidase (laccase) domain-containing protein
VAAAAEFYPALTALPGILHAFTLRIPDVDVRVDRDLAMRRLTLAHADVRLRLGLENRPFIAGEQTHGAGVAVVDVATVSPVPTVDGLITADAGVCLGVYVADCGPVYLADPVKHVIGLLHSGRKGTEKGITTVAIERMVAEFGCAPEDIVVQLGPCIRPPLYEIDFAAGILGQARDAGVRQVHDCGVCTGRNVDRYYSYRVEKGRTGRMVAILALA